MKFSGANILSTGVSLLIFLSACEQSLIEKGETCLKLGDFQRAAVFFNAAVDKAPDSPQARYGLALAWLRHCSAPDKRPPASVQDWQLAVNYLEQAKRSLYREELNPQFAMAYYRLAKVLEAAGDTIGALEPAGRAVRYDEKNIDMLNYAGILSHHAGREKKAVAYFGQAIGLDSGNATAYFNLGMLKWYQNNPVEAFEWWGRALQRNPDDEDILYWFAQAEMAIRKGLNAPIH